MSELVIYNSMVTAIAECHRVDEVKDLHDKALALEIYARQAQNIEAERKASDVRLRAERRAGELLKELARAAKPNPTGINGKEKTSEVTRKRGGQPEAAPKEKEVSPYRAALESSKIPERTAQRYQNLADVSEEVFEEHLSDPVRKPTTTAIINEARDPQPHKQMDTRTLRFWGMLRDVERLGFFQMDAARAYDEMTETMQADVQRLLPLVVGLFSGFQEAIYECA